MVILMAGVIFAEPDVDVDVDADAEVMLSWEIRLLCALLKKVNKQWTTNNEQRRQTPEVRAISAAKTDVDADSDADAAAADDDDDDNDNDADDDDDNDNDNDNDDDDNDNDADDNKPHCITSLFTKTLYYKCVNIVKPLCEPALPIWTKQI